MNFKMDHKSTEKPDNGCPRTIGEPGTDPKTPSYKEQTLRKEGLLRKTPLNRCLLLLKEGKMICFTQISQGSFSEENLMKFLTFESYHDYFLCSAKND